MTGIVEGLQRVSAVRRWLVCAVLCAVALGAWGAARADAYIYWANNTANTIGRANDDGTGVNQSFVSANTPNGIFVDGSHIYWADFRGESVGRANLDGTGATSAFITGTDLVTDVTVAGGYIYWTNFTTGTIGRASADGTGVDQSFITGLQNPTGVVVANGHIYWATFSDDTIGRANLDGTGVDSAFITGANIPFDVTSDGTYLYWGNSNGTTIGRAALDGTGVNESFISGASAPRGVLVQDGHLFWSNYGNATIGRANLDGTGVDQAFVSGASDPIGVGGSTAPTDATAPTLTSSAAANGGAGPVIVGGTDYYRGQVLVTLHATDAGSGIAQFDCTIDGSQHRTFIPGQSINGGGPPNVPGAPGSTDVQFAFDFNSAGVRTYSCTATDVAGNTSTASSGSFVIDNTAPTTTATTTPAGGIGAGAVTVTLNATDPSPGVGVQSITYAINGGTPTTVSGASTSFSTPAAQGTYTITYFATDKLGNVETTQTKVVHVDTTKPAAPTVDQYFVPVGSSYSGILSGTAHDNLGVASVKVKLTDAIGTITYTHTFTATCTGCGVPGTTDVTWSVDFSGRLPARGNYIASITVTDLAGNTRTVSNAAIIVQT